MATAYAVGPLGLDLDQRASVLPPVSSSVPTRPISLSFSSAMSKESSTSDSSQASREKSHSFSSADVLSSVTTSDTDIQSEDLPSPPPRDLYTLETSGLANNTASRVPLVSPERLKSLKERSLAMHLYRTYNIVLGCQEALWEELKDRIRNRKCELEPFGWEDEDEFEEVQNRKKFERLLERYRKCVYIYLSLLSYSCVVSDMQLRVSLWCSVKDIGWPLPPREPLTKAELIEEERMREAMLEARRNATFEDQQLPCRSVRVLVGFKP